jgi:predicted nucleic acid-binding protein
MTIVVDASVAIKWAVDEEPAEETEASRAIVGRYDVAAPALFDFELASILWVKCRRGVLTPDEADAIALTLQAAPVRRIDGHGLWLRALSLAQEVGHSPYDCAYVAAALEIGADAVVTADRRFVRAFQSWHPPGSQTRPLILPVTEIDRIPPAVA